MSFVANILASIYIDWSSKNDSVHNVLDSPLLGPLHRTPAAHMVVNVVAYINGCAVLRE